MIIAEKENGDLVISNQNYTLSAGLSQPIYPEITNSNLLMGDFSRETGLEMYVLILPPHDMRKTGIPKFDPANEILEDFSRASNFFALAANNNPNSDSGGSSDYIGYNSSSISEPSVSLVIRTYQTDHGF